jgi:hypothetical protein
MSFLDPDPQARHLRAAETHEQAARQHEEAAVRWVARGDDERAKFEWLNASLEREAAGVERERAELEWLHARVEAKAALLERERARVPARRPPRL